MRFATSIFTILASFALLVLMLEAVDSSNSADTARFISVFEAGTIGLAIWVINAVAVFRFPKAAAALYVLAGTVMLAFGFLDYGQWNGIFIFGVVSFAFAAMAWASWLVKVLWTDGARPNPPAASFATEESLARG